MAGRKQRGVLQNEGWLDRLIRFMIGTALLTTGLAVLGIYFSEPTWMAEQSAPTWTYYAMLISLYPFLTAVMGWDPVYSAFNIKSCGGSPRNPCGTFPFEVDAAMGHRPIPHGDDEHSLESSHHEGGDRSRRYGT